MRRTCITFLIFLISTSFSQNIESIQYHLNKIDSLAFNENLQETENSMQTLVSQLDGKLANQLMGNFNMLRSNIISAENVLSNSISYNQLLIINYKKYRYLYTSENSGEWAERAFNEFLTLTDSSQVYEGLKYYYIAGFSREMYLAKAYLEAKETYKKAENYFRMRQFEKALVAIDSSNIILKPNLYLSQLQDSLLSLKNKAIICLKDQEAYFHYWNREIYPQRNLSLILALHLFHQSPVDFNNYKFIRFDSSGEKQAIHVDKIPGSYRTGISLGIEYMFIEDLVIGSALSYTQFVFSSKWDQRLIFFDYEINEYAGQLYAKYLIRPYVGLQPFVSLGAGLAKYHRSKFILIFGKSIYEPVPGIEFQYFEIQSRSLTNFRILGELGIQYIRNKGSRFSLGFKLSLYQNFRNFDLIEPFNYYFTLYLTRAF